METNDLTLEVLKQIRDDTRRTGRHVEETKGSARRDHARLNETNVRLEHLRDDLGRRIVESELRTAPAITELAGTVRELKQRLPDA